MKSILFIFFFFSLVKILPAQDTSINVGSKTTLNDVIPAHHQYQYATFLDGEVQFRDGKISVAKMNYNILTNEMLFITPGADTLAVDNEPTISLICVAADTFYFDKVFIMLLKNSGSLKLGVRQCFRLVDKKNQAAYDLTSSTSSVSNLNSYDDGTSSHQLEVKQEVSIRKIQLYYIGDKFNHFYPVTKQALLDLFPNCHSEINKFLTRNKIDVNKRSDLIHLVEYLQLACF